MKQSRLIEEQIIDFLNQAVAGIQISELGRQIAAWRSATSEVMVWQPWV